MSGVVQDIHLPLEISKPILNLIPSSAFEFRVKKLAIAVLIALGTVLATAAIITAALAAFSIVAVAFPIGAAAACAAVAGIALWRKATPHLPATLKRISQYVQGTADEALSLLALTFLCPLNLEKFDPKERQVKKGEIPVLFIHGFLGRSNHWVYHKRRLQEKGHQNLFTINLGDPRCSISEYAEKVKTKVDSILTLTKSKEIILVAHSMGGLVARRYLYKHKPEDVKIRKIITIGTPLAGTYLARIASWFCDCAYEMHPHSRLTEKLKEAQINDVETNYVHIGSVTDFIVPRESATAMPRPPRKNTKIVDLEATGHAGQLFSDTVGDYIVQEVEEVQTGARQIYTETT